MVTFDTVQPLDTLLLSRRPYLPLGEVALLYGAGSLGKGRAVCSIVAAVTRGEPAGIDDAAEDIAGDAVLILPEDKQGEQAVKRLMAAGADLRRCHDLTRKGDGSRFKLSASPLYPGDLGELRALVGDLRLRCMCGHRAADRDGRAAHLAGEGGGCAPRNPRLVVIDPIGACVGDGTIQTSKGARHFIESLQDFADQAGVCVLIVAHPVGSGKLQGSHALEQALRYVYAVSRDEADPELRVWSKAKANDIPPEYDVDLRFTIRDDGDGPRCFWVKPEPVTARSQGWRDDLAERRQARDAGVPSPARPAPVPDPAGRLWAAVVTTPYGRTLVAKDIGDVTRVLRILENTAAAKALADAGEPVRWRQDPDGTRLAGNREYGLAAIPYAAGTDIGAVLGAASVAG